MGVVLVDCRKVPEQHAYLCIQLNEIIAELTASNYSFMDPSSIVLYCFEIMKKLKITINKSTFFWLGFKISFGMWTCLSLSDFKNLILVCLQHFTNHIGSFWRTSLDNFYSKEVSIQLVYIDMSSPGWMLGRGIFFGLII